MSLKPDRFKMENKKKKTKNHPVKNQVVYMCRVCKLVDVGKFDDICFECEEFYKKDIRDVFNLL